MGRLTSLKPQVATLAPVLKRQTDEHGHDRTAEPWRAWYSLARWRHPKWGLRARVLLRDLFTCQWPGCGRLERDTAQLVADHIRPHRGDPKLFWAETNLQTLCKPCHDSLKQREEKRSLGHNGGPRL